MHIWEMKKWKKHYDLKDPNHRTGIRLRFEKDVHPEVKRACKEFVQWMRNEYFFPMRVPIYIKSKRKIRAMDGDLVFGTFWEPADKQMEPYIRVATGYYLDDVEDYGIKSALAGVLGTIAHELTHYFQWVNGIHLTELGEERQANSYKYHILDEYFKVKGKF